ncbi:hypothetical protein K8I85_03770 [bacterium]|nr:hypothetical protein [bacterium]
MRTKWLSPVLALLVAGMIAAPASAQTIAYTNFLSFDLQSFTSQATAGLFDDDIEMISDAARLTGVDGNRLFTSFSNLSDPAGFGDNVLTYSIDHIGAPSMADHFDTGSYLIGWMGKHDKDSEYTQSIFYQRNQGKSMFEDLEDGNIGSTNISGLDAEFTGSITTTTLSGADPNEVLSDQTTNFDLKRYDERAAMDFDWGVAKDLSEDLSVGGRLFFEKDQVNSFAEGTVETVNRSDIDLVTAGTQLGVTSRTVAEYSGNGEEAFKYREMGVSFDSNYHPWEDQSVGFRLDIFGAALTNPGDLGFTFPSTAQPTGPFYGGWTRVNLRMDTGYTRVAAGTNVVGGTTSDTAADHEARSWSTSSFNYSGYENRGGDPIASVDDKRDGIGFNAKGEYNREWAGGDVNSWLGFGHRNLSIDATGMTASRSGSSFWWNDGSTDYEATNYFDRTTTVTRDGDMTMNAMELGGRWTRDMNSNVSVGVGAVLTRNTWTDDYMETFDEVTVTNAFNDGAPGDNALYDLTASNPAYDERSTTERIVDTYNVKDESKVTYLRLPVATQFHFRKRWTFNMGAQHMIMNTTRETNFDIPNNGPEGTVTTASVAAGASTVSGFPTSDYTEATTVTDRDRMNWTTYWYGLSCDITDAVQVDINGFLDTNSYDNVLNRGLPSPNLSGSGSITSVDFFRNLAISMKYIFW